MFPVFCIPYGTGNIGVSIFAAGRNLQIPVIPRINKGLCSSKESLSCIRNHRLIGSGSIFRMVEPVFQCIPEILLTVVLVYCPEEITLSAGDQFDVIAVYPTVDRPFSFGQRMQGNSGGFLHLHSRQRLERIIHSQIFRKCFVVRKSPCRAAFCRFAFPIWFPGHICLRIVHIQRIQQIYQ